MAIKPIIFSPPMVQALLAGRKTQTRRLLKRQPDERGLRWCNRWEDWHGVEIKPRFASGDILYVRETWCKDERGGVDCFYYKADMPKTEIWKGFWKPSIHMPKTAARIFLEVTGVRCERIADISEFDVISEGITQVTKDNGRTWKYGLPDMDGLPAGGCGFGWEWSEFELQPAAAFHKLIASINGPEVIEQNAWFWVYDFKVIDKPENF